MSKSSVPTTLRHLTSLVRKGECPTLEFKVYEVDPLVCERCGGELRIIAFLSREENVRRILK